LPCAASGTKTRPSAKGKTTITFGFTEGLSRAGQEVFQPIFKRMNQLG